MLAFCSLICWLTKVVGFICVCPTLTWVAFVIEFIGCLTICEFFILGFGGLIIVVPVERIPCVVLFLTI